MNKNRLDSEQRQFLKRIAKILADEPWGAEYYRAQIAAIDAIEQLEEEIRVLRALVPPALVPASRDPVATLVQIVNSA